MSSNKPLVSVVTVTYNSESQIKATLESVREQDYNNMEYIVVDGQSTDRTWDIIRQSLGITTLISEPDSGIYDAMNKGIRLASRKSDYIIFMNAGDIFYDKHVITDVIALAKSEQAHLYGDIILDGDLCKPCKKLNFYTLSTNMICHQSFFFLTRSFREHLYDVSYTLCADYKLILDLIKSKEHFEYVSLPIAVYDEKGISRQKKDLLRYEKKKIRASFPKVRAWFFFKRVAIRIRNMMK